ncbi:hypothetical protein SDC9_181722 [bioreactor metagenome]|uniref:Uncharacterized protein n=1 Tax=bioreactor metagenome TaxID=1076179 RepID=A0A645H806_9ZZZZ
MTPGFLGSSSPILNTIFIRSEPISAIFVKMPPAILSAEAPRDSPMAKPMKQAPPISGGKISRISSIMNSSSEIRTIPIDIPARRGIWCSGRGLPRSDANAVRELAKVLTRIPNHATEYEPAIPSRENSTMVSTRPQGKFTRTL